jgi:hypothetical protein
MEVTVTVTEGLLVLPKPSLVTVTVRSFALENSVTKNKVYIFPEIIAQKASRPLGLVPQSFSS